MPSPSSAPYYSASFTLLYADPDIDNERPFLQPLYTCARAHATTPNDGDDDDVNNHADNNNSSDNGGRATNAALLEMKLFAHAAGPQPVYGGAALRDVASAAPSFYGDGCGAVYMHADATPSLTSMLDADSAARLRALRTRHPAPHARSGSVGVSCAARQSLLVHGGLGDAFYNDTWEYDVHTRRWRELHCRSATAAEDNNSNDDNSNDNNNSNDTDDDDSNFPPAAYGQAGVVYRDVHGRPCLAVCGGVTPHGKYGHTLYSLALDTCTWSRVPLSVRLPHLWGATAQMMSLPRARHGNDDKHRHASSASDHSDDDDDEDDKHDDDDDDDEEDEVMVMFGGMTQHRCIHVTFLVHLRHRLTAADVYAHPQRYLDSALYRHVELRRILARIDARKQARAQAARQRRPRRYGARDAPSTSSTSSSSLSTFTSSSMSWSGGSSPRDGAARRGNAREVWLGPTRLHSLDDDSDDEDDNDDNDDYNDDDDDDVDDDDDDDDDSDSDDDVMVWPPWLGEDSLDASLRADVARWRATHPRTLARWRDARLRRMIGTCWTECLRNPPSLAGRRRPCSAVYRRHFLFVFGGRDASFYNDLWLFSTYTRRWVQVRSEVPALYMRAFFARPRDDAPRRAIARVLARVRAQSSPPPPSATMTTTMTTSTLRRHLQRRAYNDAQAQPLPRPLRRLLARNRRDDDDDDDDDDGEWWRAQRASEMTASWRNSTALARTGACMVADPLRQCIYVYGGFAFGEAQQETFYDLHVYHITEHVWRRVAVCARRDWDAHTLEPWMLARARGLPLGACSSDCSNNNNNDMRRFGSSGRSAAPRRVHDDDGGGGATAPAAASVRSNSTTTATTTTTNATVLSSAAQRRQMCAEACDGVYVTRVESVHGMGLLQYLAHYCSATAQATAAASAAPPVSSCATPRSRQRQLDVAYPPPLVVPCATSWQQRGRRRRPALVDNNNNNDNIDDDDDDERCMRYMALPVLTPAARTMACLMADPLCPGARFFLFGGRNDEAVYGDLFELRLRAFTHLDEDYGTAQQARPQQQQTSSPQQPQPPQQQQYVHTHDDHDDDNSNNNSHRPTASPTARDMHVGGATAAATRTRHHASSSSRSTRGNLMTALTTAALLTGVSQRAHAEDDVAATAAHIRARMRARVRAAADDDVEDEARQLLPACSGVCRDGDGGSARGHAYDDYGDCGRATTRVVVRAMQSATRCTLVGAAAGILRDLCTFHDDSSSNDSHSRGARVASTHASNSTATATLRASAAAAATTVPIVRTPTLHEARDATLRLLCDLFIATRGHSKTRPGVVSAWLSSQRQPTSSTRVAAVAASSPSSRGTTGTTTAAVGRHAFVPPDPALVACHRVLHALLHRERWDARRVLHERHGPTL